MESYFLLLPIQFVYLDSIYVLNHYFVKSLSPTLCNLIGLIIPANIVGSS
ncbi:hypothetical protein BCAH1134_C0525 (plasmid) [Bacillus cereus AH1134]|nr:hypothetical protein BCAH1134_C0525 [Bacillus cereus AH1134]